jgi:hypothetical protein
MNNRTIQTPCSDFVDSRQLLEWCKIPADDCHTILDTIVALAQRSFGAAYQFVLPMNSKSSRNIPRTSGAGCGIR